MSTVSPEFASDQVPELEAVAPSFTATDALVLRSPAPHGAVAVHVAKCLPVTGLYWNRDAE